ncbi:MAG: hypothetical protein HQK89_10075 [Nitrospirae bacterium]|nr:hypothetical protein [Nitrospirota bacterium]
MEILPPADWKELLDYMSKGGQTVLLLGAVDSGKSYLARYLLEGLLNMGLRVCLVDADVGQSSLGLPSTVSMKVFGKPGDIANFLFEEFFFVGSIDAARAAPLIVEGAKKFVDACRGRSDAILVDTTGLVSGSVGRDLKLRKIMAVEADTIVALQACGEAEHIVACMRGQRVFRLPISPAVKRRSREERARYRKEKVRRYFDATDVGQYILQRNSAGFLYMGRRVDIADRLIRESHAAKDGLMALCRDGRHGDSGHTYPGLSDSGRTNTDHADSGHAALAMVAPAMIVECDADSIEFLSPVKSLRGIATVLLGDVTV